MTRRRARKNRQSPPVSPYSSVRLRKIAGHVQRTWTRLCRSKKVLREMDSRTLAIQKEIARIQGELGDEPSE